MSDTKETPAPGMCRCDKNKATDPHTCPYKEEINGDKESLCTCCDECRQECIYGI